MRGSTSGAIQATSSNSLLGCSAAGGAAAALPLQQQQHSAAAPTHACVGTAAELAPLAQLPPVRVREEPWLTSSESDGPTGSKSDATAVKSLSSSPAAGSGGTRKRARSGGEHGLCAEDTQSAFGEDHVALRVYPKGKRTAGKSQRSPSPTPLALQQQQEGTMGGSVLCSATAGGTNHGGASSDLPAARSVRARSSSVQSTSIDRDSLNRQAPPAPLHRLARAWHPPQQQQGGSERGVHDWSSKSSRSSRSTATAARAREGTELGAAAAAREVAERSADAQMHSGSSKGEQLGGTREAGAHTGVCVWARACKRACFCAVSRSYSRLAGCLFCLLMCCICFTVVLA